MTTTVRAGAEADAPPSPPPSRAPWVGLGAALLLMAASIWLPTLLGWEVYSRTEPELAGSVDPLHSFVRPVLFGPGTLPSLAIAALGVWFAFDAARSLSWRALLATSYVVGLAWALAVATIRGLVVGIGEPLAHPQEYLPTVKTIDDIPRALDEWISRIPLDAPNNWETHVAGHPPLSTLIFVWMDRIGLGGDVTVGLVVTAFAASIPVAVLLTLRALGAVEVARRAAPWLVLTPAVLYLAVSEDAVIAGFAAWGIAALAVAATATSRARMVAWSVVAGLVLGSTVLLSYGMPLLGVLAVAVLIAARSWKPLPIAVVAALVPVLVFAAYGFSWWEAYPVLEDRYWDGVAQIRPGEYWTWGNLGAFLLSAGPMLGAGVAVGGVAVAQAVRRRREGDAVPLDPGVRVALLLAGAGLLMVLLATASQMSRAEVERIWLPFAPWITISLALLPDSWRRPGLALQVAAALVTEHLLLSSW